MGIWIIPVTRAFEETGTGDLDRMAHVEKI